MFSILTLKASLKKVWTWIKHYWYVPAVIVYTLLLWFIFGKKDKAHEVLKIREKSLEDQMKIINDSHKEEIEKRNEILKRYNDLVSKMEENFRLEERNLEDSKKKEIKRLVENYYNDPEELARLIAEKYGFEYVE
jgi:flagellar biosynthesis/type III secretory pathway M-ring protein FliF/YscJ